MAIDGILHLLQNDKYFIRYSHINSNISDSEYLDKIISFKEVREKQSKLQSLLASISLDAIPEKVQKVERVKILKDIVKRITGNNTEFNSVEQNLRNTEKQHEEASKQYNNLLKEAGVCPICGVSTRDLSNV